MSYEQDLTQELIHYATEMGVSPTSPQLVDPCRSHPPDRDWAQMAWNVVGWLQQGWIRQGAIEGTFYLTETGTALLPSSVESAL